MLLRSVAPALLALANLVHAQDFSSLASCGQSCINSMDTTTGCVPVTSECLCSNVNFLYGIADCANKSCASATDANAAVEYAKESCSSVLTPSSAIPAPTSEVPATSEAPVTSDTPSPTETATTSTTEPQNDAVTTSTPEEAVPTSASATTDFMTTSSKASETAGATKTASEGSSSTAMVGSSTSSSSASGASSSSSPEGAEAPGLTTGSKIGIVIGSAAGAVAVVALVLILSRKRSQPLPRGTLKISEPLPGSGRIGDDVWEQYHAPQYSPRPPRTAGSNMSELDKHARPYDEMVPRMTPTRMV